MMKKKTLKKRVELMKQYNEGVITGEELGKQLLLLTEKCKKERKVLKPKLVRMNKYETSKPLKSEVIAENNLQDYNQWKNEGLSDREISKKLNVSTEMLVRAKRIWNKKGYIFPRMKAGRKPKFSK